MISIINDMVHTKINMQCKKSVWRFLYNYAPLCIVSETFNIEINFYINAI